MCIILDPGALYAAADSKRKRDLAEAIAAMAKTATDRGQTSPAQPDNTIEGEFAVIEEPLQIEETKLLENRREE